MRNVFVTIGVLIVLGSSAGHAGPLEDAQAAHRQGDYVQAVKWYQIAADQGDAQAQLSLGIAYSRGEGVPKDFVQAVKWYQLAAEQGVSQAQLYLGVAYFRGEGVMKDYLQAYMWSNLAASGGSSQTQEKAAEARDALAVMMTPAQIAEAQRMSREWKPK